MKKVKVLLVGSVILCILLMIIIVMSTNSNVKEWQSINQIKACRGLLDGPIRSITLRQTTDSAEWAVFDDEDLIHQWETYFASLEVMYERPVTKLDMEGNGGMPVIAITTDTAKYTFRLHVTDGKDIIEIGNDYYTYRSSLELPFTETYNAAIERHGVITPWD